MAVPVAHMVAPVSAAQEEVPVKRAKGAGGRGQLLNGVASAVRSVVLDAEAVLAEMRVMGAGLVEECMVRHSP